MSLILGLNECFQMFWPTKLKWHSPALIKPPPFPPLDLSLASSLSPVYLVSKLHFHSRSHRRLPTDSFPEVWTQHTSSTSTAFTAATQLSLLLGRVPGFWQKYFPSIFKPFNWQPEPGTTFTLHSVSRAAALLLATTSRCCCDHKPDQPCCWSC